MQDIITRIDNMNILFMAECAYNDAILLESSTGLVTMNPPKKKADFKKKLNDIIKNIVTFFENLKEKVSKFFSNLIINIDKALTKMVAKNEKLKKMYEDIKRQRSQDDILGTDDSETSIKDYFVLFDDTKIEFTSIINKNDINRLLLQEESLDIEKYSEKIIRGTIIKCHNGYEKEFYKCKNSSELKGCLDSYYEAIPKTIYRVKDLYNLLLSGTYNLKETALSLSIQHKKNQFDKAMKENIDLALKLEAEFNKAFIMSNSDEEANAMDKHFKRVGEIKQVMFANQAIASFGVTMSSDLYSKVAKQLDILSQALATYLDMKQAKNDKKEADKEQDKKKEEKK